MPAVQHPTRRSAVRALRLASAIAAGLAVSACAGLGGLAGDAPQASLAKPETDNRGELEKATEHWGKEFEKNPRNATFVLNYAKNLKALGQKEKALQVLQDGAVFNGNHKGLASEYGRLALEFDQISAAQKLLEIADDPVKPDWRVLSARGTVLAKQERYKDAIPFYERALALAPEQASVLNNLALAHTMSGDAAKGEPYLRQAAAKGAAPRVQQNLAMVLGMQGKYDEAKVMAGKDMQADAAAADVDYMRRMTKLAPRAAGSPDPAEAAAGDWGVRISAAIASGSQPAKSARVAAAPVAAPAPSDAKPGVFTFKPSQQ